MENPLQDLEFLDLSNINESEKHQLQSVLYAPNPNARYPELPWCGGSMPVLHIVEPPPPPLDWMSHQQYASVESQGELPLLNGSVEAGEDDDEDNTPCCLEAEEAHPGDSEGEAPVYPGTPAPPPTSVASQAPPPVYPPPFSHVYVNNMTANVSVHGYMAGVGGPPPPATAFHQMPPNMYPGPPPSTHAAEMGGAPPASGGGSGQKKRYKGGNSSSSNTSSGGSANRRLEHQQQHAPPPQPVEVQQQPQPHPHHHGHGGPPMNYQYGGGPPNAGPGAPGFYPMYFHPGPPQHAQGGSPLYLAPHHQHPMYHHHHGGPPPPHQVYYSGIPPVSHVEETMQQQSYMVSQQHQLAQQQQQQQHHHHQHHHQQQQQKSSPHHHQQQHIVSHHPPPPPKHHPQPPAAPSLPEEEINVAEQEEWQERNGGPAEEQYEEEGGEYDEEEAEAEVSNETEDYARDAEVSDSPHEGNGNASLNSSLSSAPEQAPSRPQSTGPVIAASADKEAPPAPFPVASPETIQSEPHDTVEKSSTETVVVPSAPVAAAAPDAPKTWASLLKKSNGPSFGDQTISGSPGSGSKPCARVEPLTSNSYQSSVTSSAAAGAVAPAGPPSSYSGARYYNNSNSNNGQYARNRQSYSTTDDGSSQNLGKLLVSTRLDHKGISLLPRGLINKSNYCYINATLQALIACPPFYNLLRTINKQRNGGYYPSAGRNSHYNNNAASPASDTSNTPIFNAMLQLAGEFSYLQLSPGGGGLRRDGMGGGGRRNDDADLKIGTPFAPTYVYQILASIKSDSAFNVEGRQEDAEEFLTFLLNGLNDEMLELIKGQSKDGESSDGNSGSASGVGKAGGNKSSSARATGPSNGEMNGDLTSGDADDGDWKEVTKESKNKGAIVRRHTSVSDKTPVSEIFRGQVRTRVHRVSDSTVTENIQPFFTLPLDIEKVSSVKEALDLLVLREGLEGVTSTKTNQETEAYQTVTLEELPFVLLLHLKCFDYKSHSCHKIQKSLEFPVLLSLEPKLLSNGKMKKVGGGPIIGQKNKQYKLFAVVYHDGKEASKGHYITDVFHVGYSGWIRYDDANVRFVAESEVLHSRPPRVPYILYYRRADTIVSKNLSPTS